MSGKNPYKLTAFSQAKEVTSLKELKWCNEIKSGWQTDRLMNLNSSSK